MELKVIRNKPERPSLNEMQDFVGGSLELLTLEDGDQMLINKEAEIRKLPINYPASFQALKDIYGNAIILENDARLSRIYRMFSRNF